jgi:stearoyl-CoA desaturase (delta-9 desaturase)
MAFIDHILKKPSYGWMDPKGDLISPSTTTLFRSALNNINIFKSRKNWMPFLSTAIILLLIPVFVVFVSQYLSILTLLAFLVYGMVLNSVHGTIWHHRFCTHKAYEFSNPIWRIITQNLVVRTVSEEAYAISHRVHHAKSDLPGDPYNAKSGLMYCMLAEFNHQNINRDLKESDYNRVSHFLSHTGIKRNSFAQYKKWGTITNPLYAVAMLLLNWTFWFAVFYLIGGLALVTAAFSGTLAWFLAVRYFNYVGHGGGKAKHQDGIDYDRRNLSINQVRPGLLGGEWHNNHHLYPSSARAGFLPGQLDLAWIYIWSLHKIGGVSSYKDFKAQFLEKYVVPNKLEEPKKAPGPKAGKEKVRAGN